MKLYNIILITSLSLFAIFSSAQNNITFQVDMSTVDSSTFTTPEVNGNFNGWCGSCASMSDPDGDNIWDVIITIDINTNYEFKFSADNWGIQESLLPGSPCTVTNFGFTNRTLNVLGDTTLPVVCWESCDDCSTGPSAYNVTFEVDMRGVTSSYITPEVNGVFNSWCGNCWQMDDSDGDSIWQFTTVFAPGDSLEWKYSADNWTIQEDLDSSLSCITINYDPGAPNGYGFVNRVAVVNSDTTFSAPWNLCSNVSNTINGCTDSLASNYDPLATVDDGSCLYSTTFNVDMNCDTTSFVDVNLESASFGWCGGCLIMSDPDGDGIHSITLDLPLGNFEYKYGLDSWSYSENLVDDMLAGGTCAPITDYSSYANRLLIVTQGSITNDTYSSCDSCIVNPIITSHTINAGNYYYNPNYLVINVGDTVTWFNDGGYHDVNGNVNSQTGLSFGNPVSFYLSAVSGPATIGSYIFNVAGTYDYDCSIGNHALNGMIGTILVNTPSLSQIDLPISWDDTTADYTVTDFGGNSSSLSVDPLDPSNNVLMSDKTAGAQTWSGTTLSTPNGLLSSIPFISGSTTISAHVYSPLAGTIVRLKAEDHTDPTRSVETEATTTVANGWNTLVFDFSNEAPGTAMIDFSYNYDMLSIFYDFGNGGVGDVYYLDSVVFGGLVSGTFGCTDPTALNYNPNATIDDSSCTYGPSLSQIDLPISWDDTTVNYTVTDFGGTVSTLSVDPLDSLNNVLMTDRTAGSQTWGGTTLSTPNGLLSSIPFVSGATTISAHVYSPASGITVRLKAEDHTDPTKSVETESTTTVANGWSTLVFDFSNEATGTAMINFTYNYDMLSIFYDFGNVPSLSSIYYLDSIVFGTLATNNIPGCIDSLAANFDSLATIDDGSCLYSVTFNVDMNCDTNSFGYVHLESPVFGWCGGCVPMTDPDGDGIHSVSVDLASGDFEYKYAVDGFAGQEDLLDDMLAGESCAPITDYFSYANRLVTVVAGITTADVYGSCNICIVGCTDPLANNYDSLATFDDSSCIYCLFGCTDSLAFNYDSLATCDDGSCIPFIFGCTDPNAINYYPGANTDDGSCIFAGCTDPLANNYDPNATIDDGSCTYMNCTDPTPSGLANDWVTDTKAGITWNNMNDSACMVLKYFVRYREVGTPTWLTKSAGVGNGLCNFGLNTTNKILQNLVSGTTYEYKMKAFYCGGTESNYSAPSQFTTAADCPGIANLTANTFNSNQSKVTFTWDTTGAYVFARVALRVDTAGANWQTAGGFGVYYPTLSVNKFGLQSGESYRAQGRAFCDSNITSYRSWWTSPIFWTQPGSIRMSGGSIITNLDVYPNPTDDIFNISFVSDEIQTLSIRVINIVGEVVYTESLEHFVGEYTKKISIGDNSKGIYFLEITDNSGTINKKIIVQ